MNLLAKTHEELLTCLEQALEDLAPRVEAGDEDAFIEAAMGKAIYRYMLQGGRLTDLTWFSDSPHYTGKTHQKAA